MIAFGWLMLILWPVVTIVLFLKKSLPVAICGSIIGGYLLLPTRLGIDLPLLPVLDKHTIPALSALVMTAVVTARNDPRHQVLRGWIPREPLTLFLLGLLLVGAVGTVMTNQDALFYGPRVIPGLRMYDAFSVLLTALMLITPLLLARRVLGSVEGQRVLVWSMAVYGLAYTLPALWEIRMSPQLHHQIYGFYSHQFLQQVRAGGFRPTVFLIHGLSVGIFLSFTVIAAIGLSRASQTADMRYKWLAAAAWLFVVLFLAKSLGAFAITLLLAPVVLFCRARTQLLVAACIAGTVMTYPVLRAAHLIPVDQIMSLANDVSPARAQSLDFRLHHEENLLAKAQERPLFGWGGWSRNRVFDPESGRDISVTDGSWIIELGVGGWFRYVAIFGLMCWPAVGLFISKRDRIDPICAALSLMLAAKLIDFIPNSGMVPIIFLMAGSLIGRLEMSLADVRSDGSPEPETAAPRLASTRQQGLTPAMSSERQPTYARSFETHSKRPQKATSRGREQELDYRRTRPVRQPSK